MLLSAIKIVLVVTYRAFVREKELTYPESFLTLVKAVEALVHYSFQQLHVPVSQSCLHHWSSVCNTATVAFRMYALQRVKVMEKIARQSDCLLYCC